jgi:hypothetical protein
MEENKMRKLIQAIVRLFQPVPEDVVNTGYMTQDQIREYREKHGLCVICGAPDAAPEGTHPDVDGLCHPCHIKENCS